MPKTGEKQRKLDAIDAGKDVRPPSKWFSKMQKEIKKEYPTYSQKRRDQIVGGIWAKYPPKTQKKIVRKYQT